MACSQEENYLKDTDFKDVDTDADPLQLLLSVISEVQRSQWRKEEYNRILFCQIKDLKHFELSDIQYQNNPVFTSKNYKTFSNEKSNFEIPIMSVLFCGTVINSKIEGNYRWFEIGSDNETILCRADLVSSSNLQDDINKKYYEAHQRYRDIEKEFQKNPSSTTKEAMNESFLLWQLRGRSKELSTKLNEVQFKDKNEIKNKNVIVIGKLWQKDKKKFVIMQQCRFVSENEEKHISEMINLQKITTPYAL